MAVREAHTFTVPGAGIPVAELLHIAIATFVSRRTSAVVVVPSDLTGSAVDAGIHTASVVAHDSLEDVDQLDLADLGWLVDDDVEVVWEQLNDPRHISAVADLNVLDDTLEELWRVVQDVQDRVAVAVSAIVPVRLSLEPP